MLEIGVLLGTTQALTALGFGLVRIEIFVFLRLSSPLLAVLFYPLGLRLLVCLCGFFGCGGGFLGLLGLLTLCVGVVRGIP